MTAILQTRYYDIGQTQVKISVASQTWAALLDLYMAIPWRDKGREDLTVDLFECSTEEIGDLIPRLDHKFKVVDSFVETKPRIIYKAYYDGICDVKDFNGLGRVFINYGSGQARIGIVSGQIYAGIFPLMLLFQNSLNSLLALHQFYSVHSACAAIDGHGIMITGHSGKGKSTSSMALLKRGHPLVTDERVLLRLDKTYKAYGITDVIKVGQSAAARFFPEVLKHKPIYEIDEGDMCFKSSLWKMNSFDTDVEIKSLLFLQQTGDSHSWLEPINPARSIGEFFPVTIGSSDRHMIQKKFDFLMGFLSKTPCYRMHFGTDMDQFASVVESLVK